jgi:hypothetical protein
MTNVDFQSDWRESLEQGMAAHGSPYDPATSLKDNTITYLNAKRRSVPPLRRIVRESKELQIPVKHSADYLALKKLIGEGGDLSPYLSREIRKNRADRNDAMLNNWGFHHLHFSPRGDRDVLFVRITETDAFVIQALPHGPDNSETWVDTELLRILHENWPDAAVGKILGIHGESLMPTQRINLRNKNCNFATTMPDGTVYLAPGGGVSASGRCSLDVRDSDLIFRGLAFWQKVVEENEAKLRSPLNAPVSEELSLKMMKFGNDECWLYEQTRKKIIHLTAKLTDIG